jgi:hypothetical protein
MGQNVPPMPPSIIAGQGQQAAQQQDQSLQQQTLQMATQKLLEYKNTLESLLTVMKAVDPESVALFMPAIEFGQALEARLAQVNKRAAAPQPSMGGMVGGQSPPVGMMGGQQSQGQDQDDLSGGTAAGM